MWIPYKVAFEFAGATTAICIAEFTPADDIPMIVTDISIKVTSEVQEAQEEWLEVEFQRGGTAMTTGNGSAATPSPDTPKLPAASTTVETGGTTLPTYTSGTTPWRDAFNVRAGGEWHFTPETVLGCTQGNGGCDIRLPNAPTDAIDIKGTIDFAEWL